jgi:hypothetical protein
VASANTRMNEAGNAARRPVIVDVASASGARKKNTCDSMLRSAPTWKDGGILLGGGPAHVRRSRSISQKHTSTFLTAALIEPVSDRFFFQQMAEAAKPREQHFKEMMGLITKKINSDTEYAEHGACLASDFSLLMNLDV